jgi:hypothetical protein
LTSRVQNAVSMLHGLSNAASPAYTPASITTTPLRQRLATNALNQSAGRSTLVMCHALSSTPHLYPLLFQRLHEAWSSLIHVSLVSDLDGSFHTPSNTPSQSRDTWETEQSVSVASPFASRQAPLPASKLSKLVEQPANYSLLNQTGMFLAADRQATTHVLHS